MLLPQEAACAAAAAAAAASLVAADPVLVNLADIVAQSEQ